MDDSSFIKSLIVIMFTPFFEVGLANKQQVFQHAHTAHLSYYNTVSESSIL